MNTEVFGELAARMLDLLDEQFGDEPEATLSDVAVIAYVRLPSSGLTACRMVCSDGEWQRQLGILAGAKSAVLTDVFGWGNS